jgi:ribosomal protein S18 acetylase RimI-like enzyme
MRREGVDQWDEIYPNMDIVAEDARNRSLYVTDSEGICLATVCLDWNQPPEYSPVNWSSAGQVMVIHRLCVDPAYQGQGIAGRLMDFAEWEARRRGSRWIRLDAYSANHQVVRMYERRGYRIMGEIRFPRRELPFYCFEKDMAGDTAA